MEPAEVLPCGVQATTIEVSVTLRWLVVNNSRAQYLDDKTGGQESPINRFADEESGQSGSVRPEQPPEM
ncbi:MAG: hypothetical protein DMG68_03210 [Acidobacteria bacterium]|nr:MAG: hypothetical protein DMG68_03210 [Acidobacteriota bacterium]